LGDGAMSQNPYLLNHLDDPMRFLFFTLDEFFVLAIPLFVGMFIGKMFLGAFCALVLYQVLKGIKKAFKNANFRQLTYWFLPTPKTTFKVYVPSYYREFQG
jgi:type IV conjugative transfer system protein TraL